VPSDPVVETVEIRASPEAVFRYFTQPGALTQWLGEAADVEPRPGGLFSVRIGGETIRGHYVRVEPPRRLSITWGREGSELLPPGVSEVDVRFDAIDGGTRVTLEHRGLPTSEGPRHREGWRHFLGRLGTAVPDGQETT
jgi:uncharacterized protein YndB with AHSA1/START domain